MAQITKEKFLRYRKVQLGGRYNMITQASKAMKSAGLTYDEYVEIIFNFCKYYEKYISTQEL